MAQTQDGPPIVFPPPVSAPCDCFGSRPQDFKPPFSALSDLDLDVCEIIALSLLGGAGSLDYNVIKYAFTMTRCFQCMTDRQRREYEIWWVLFLPGCTTGEELKTLIREIESKQTPDAIKAALTGLRSYVWDYATCGDI